MSAPLTNVRVSPFTVRRAACVLLLGGLLLSVGCQQETKTLQARPITGFDSPQRSQVGPLRPTPEPKLLPVTHFASAQLLEGTGDLEAAVQQYRQAIALNHDFIAAYERLGLLLDQLGRFHQAERVWQQAVARAPNRPSLHNNFGFHYLLQRRYAQAATHFDNALMVDPTYQRARMNLGITLAQVGQHEAALELFREALPEAQAQFNLGLVLRQNNRLVEAREAFQAALQADPYMSGAHVHLEQIEPAIAALETPEPEGQAELAAVEAPTAPAPGEDLPEAPQQEQPEPQALATVTPEPVEQMEQPTAQPEVVADSPVAPTEEPVVATAVDRAPSLLQEWVAVIREYVSRDPLPWEKKWDLWPPPEQAPEPEPQLDRVPEAELAAVEAPTPPAPAEDLPEAWWQEQPQQQALATATPEPAEQMEQSTAQPEPVRESPVAPVHEPAATATTNLDLAPSVLEDWAALVTEYVNCDPLAWDEWELWEPQEQTPEPEQQLGRAPEAELAAVEAPTPLAPAEDLPEAWWQEQPQQQARVTAAPEPAEQMEQSTAQPEPVRESPVAPVHEPAATATSNLGLAPSVLENWAALVTEYVNCDPLTWDEWYLWEPQEVVSPSTTERGTLPDASEAAAWPEGLEPRQDEERQEEVLLAAALTIEAPAPPAHEETTRQDQELLVDTWSDELDAEFDEPAESAWYRWLPGGDQDTLGDEDAPPPGPLPETATEVAVPLGQVIDEAEAWRDSDGLGDPLLADADSVRAPLLHQEAARAQRRRPAEPDQAAIALLLAEPEPADTVLASAKIWNPPADVPLPWDLAKQLGEAPTALGDQPAPEPPTQNAYFRRWGPRFLELVDLTAPGLPISPIPTPVR